MPRFTYVNGSYMPHSQASIHVEDRGFLFADSVYEVVSLINGHFADEVGHLDRLERSLSELRISMPMSRRALQIVLRTFVRRNRLKNAYIYFQVTRGVAPRDFKFPKDIKPSLVIMCVGKVSFDIAARKKMLKKAVTVPDLRWKRRDIKTTALTAQVMAKQAAVDEGAYEALMVDDDGFVTEGASTNFWIVNKEGVLITRPPEKNMILKGVTRNSLQALCKRENIKLEERAFKPEEIYAAEEAFVSAAGTLVTAIVEVDGYKIGNGKLGNLTSKLLDLYMAYAKDINQKQESWHPK